MEEKELEKSVTHENDTSSTQNTNNDIKNSDKSAGPVVGTIIIVVVLALGGLYFWGQRTSEKEVFDNTLLEASEIIETPDSILESLEKQGASDEIEDIEADLNLDLLEDLDAELDNIDAELNF